MKGKVICSVCRKFIRTIELPDGPMDISHGYCSACADRILHSLKIMVKKGEAKPVEDPFAPLMRSVDKVLDREFVSDRNFLLYADASREVWRLVGQCLPWRHYRIARPDEAFDRSLTFCYSDHTIPSRYIDGNDGLD